MSRAIRDAARLTARLASFAALFSAAVGGGFITTSGVVLGAQKGMELSSAKSFFVEGTGAGTDGLNLERGVGVEGRS